MKNRTWLWLCLVAVAAVTVAPVWISAQGHHDDEGVPHRKAQPKMVRPTAKPASGAANVAEVARTNRQRLGAVLKAIDAATKAVEAGDKKAALAALHKARAAAVQARGALSKLLARPAKAARKWSCPMHPDVLSDKPGKCPKCGMALVKASPKIANARCPIMGSPIKPARVTPSLLRRYKGANVAFCCAGCPEAWDKLSDAQKEAKLAAAGKAK